MDNRTGAQTSPQLVWDLPVRIFHWTLVLLVIAQAVTATMGGNAMEYHALGGYAILTLVLFRILWGFVGGTHARFAGFVHGPVATLRYATSLFSSNAVNYHGHNPLGGWSVLLMLASMLVQATTGLFANDDVMMEGPLAKHVSGRASEIATAIHDVNAVVLLTLIALHLLAVLFYLFGKKQNLIGPMFSGRKPADAASVVPVRNGSLVLAATLLAAVALLVCFVVTF